MTARRTQRGFTLIELMIVVVIIAVVFAGVGLSIGATQRVKLRSSCYTLMSAVRYAFSRAVTQGTTVRLVLDIEGGGLHLEETKGRVVLNREDETGEGLKRSDEEERDRESESESKEDSFLDLSGSSGSSSSSPFGGAGLGFGMELDEEGGLNMGGFMDGFMSGSFDEMTVSGFFGNAEGYKRPRFEALPGKRGKARQMQGETVFTKVFTPHDPNPREEGRAFIYFFPSGMAEHSFIHLSDGDERVYTIEVHPLSGKSFLYTEEVEPEEELDALQEADE